MKIAREKERFLRLIQEDLLKAEPEKVFSRIVKAGSDIFHLCDCQIYLEKEGSFFLRASSTTEASASGIHLLDERTKETLQGDEPKIFSAEELPELKEKGVKKLVIAPFKAEKEFYGVIVFECKTEHNQFMSSELDFVKTLALQATEALRVNSLKNSLEQKDNLINSLLDSTEDRITIHDRNQRIVRINKAGLKFLDLSEEEVLGKNCYQVLYNQEKPEACPCYMVLKGKEPFFQQIKLNKEKSGREGFLKIWAYPLLSSQGEVEGVLEYAKFEEVQEIPPDKGRKEVPREFFNDLNNILAGILGNAELIAFHIRPYKEIGTGILADQIKLIEELVIEGSKLIREVRGEIEESAEKKKIPEKKSEIEKEKEVAQALKILAIDDQKIILDLLESVLLSLGHKIKVASSGKDGLELFLQDGFDLVITDLSMPEMSGWEVSQKVKQIRKETPVILITGWGVNLDKDKIRELGVDYFLPKPFKVEQLSRLLEQIKDEKLKNKTEKSQSS